MASRGSAVANGSGENVARKTSISRLGLFLNPRARQVRNLYLHTNRFWEGMIPSEHVWVPLGIEALRRDMKEAHQQDLDGIAILGGDGTLHLTLSVLLEVWPPPYPAIVPLPGGTINALCNEIGIHTPCEPVLAGIVEAMAGRGELEFIPKHLIHLTDSSGTDRHGCTFANGIIFRAFHDYYASEQPDVTDALRVTMNTIISAFLPANSPKNRFRPMEGRVTADGKEWANGSIRVIAASVLENPVLWFRPYPTTLDAKPRFHCLLNKMDSHEVAFNAWPLMRGRAEHPDHITEQIQTIEIETSEGYVFDGEVFDLPERSSIRMEIGPQMHFVRPKGLESKRAFDKLPFQSAVEQLSKWSPLGDR